MARVAYQNSVHTDLQFNGTLRITDLKLTHNESLEEVLIRVIEEKGKSGPSFHCIYTHHWFGELTREVRHSDILKTGTRYAYYTRGDKSVVVGFLIEIAFRNTYDLNDSLTTPGYKWELLFDSKEWTVAMLTVLDS